MASTAPAAVTLLFSCSMPRSCESDTQSLVDARYLRSTSLRSVARSANIFPSKYRSMYRRKFGAVLSFFDSNARESGNLLDFLFGIVLLTFNSECLPLACCSSSGQCVSQKNPYVSIWVMIRHRLHLVLCSSVHVTVLRLLLLCNVSVCVLRVFPTRTRINFYRGSVLVFLGAYLFFNLFLWAIAAHGNTSLSFPFILISFIPHPKTNS